MALAVKQLDEVKHSAMATHLFVFVSKHVFKLRPHFLTPQLLVRGSLNSIATSKSQIKKSTITTIQLNHQEYIYIVATVHYIWCLPSTIATTEEIGTNFCGVLIFVHFADISRAAKNLKN